LTDAGEKTGRATLRRLDDIRQIFPTRDREPLPLRIFLFAAEKEFRGYADNAVTDGFYHGGGERDLIVLHGGAGLTRAVTHEYIHLILDRGPGPLPLWFEEGTAELYSNLDLQRGRIIAGEPIAEHLQTLGAGRWLDAVQLTAASRRSPLYNERTLAGVFYSESWALVHMLNLAPGWRERMPRYAEMLMQGRNGSQAFPEAFEKSMDQALAELNGTGPEEVLVRMSPGGWNSVRQEQLREFAGDGKGSSKLGSLLPIRQVPFLHPDHPLEMALRYVDRWPIVPVVSRADFRQLEGVVSQRTVLERYREFGEG